MSESCKARVLRGRHYLQCSRIPAKDCEGYCRQHYPPNVAARNKAQAEKWIAEREAREEESKRKSAADREQRHKAECFDDLLAALKIALQHFQPEPCYGFFLGGDPRGFSPDVECSAEEEIQRHKEDCAAWGRGDHVERAVSGCNADGSIHFCRSPYGRGTYYLESEEMRQAREAIEAAIAKAEGGLK